MGLLKAEGVIYKATEKVDLSADSHEPYQRANVKAPRMAGFVLKMFAWFLESNIFGPFLLYILKRNNLIHKLVSNAELEESPLYVPLHPFADFSEKEENENLSPSQRVQKAVQCLPPSLSSSSSSNLSFRRYSIMDYFNAYNSAQITPFMVAKRIIGAIGESCDPSLDMAFFINYDIQDILRQAEESTQRYQKGEPLSVLDGVPIAVKDEIDCTPYPTTGGTKWLHLLRSCKSDAYCVMCLRSCGAMLIGKTNMHELGAGTSGINPHYGATRNPYDAGKIAGGSSSGSAAVVAAGLCPVALGVDGGGSVRMPAALCGVVGFKPTFGRTPHSGVLPLNWTVGMVGVISGTIEDAFIIYAAISYQLPSQELSAIPPPKLYFPILNSTSPITNVTLARYGEWFNDCRDDIKTCCSDALEETREKYGWKTIEVTIPEIEGMRLAHYITIGSECSTSLSRYLPNDNMKELGWDVRAALCVYGAFTAQDYVKAQQLRNRLMKFHKSIFAKADVIVTPTTGVTAYPILKDALHTGELDYVNGAALVRYQIAGNFLGLPAVTIPVGYDNMGLPIGLQFIGKPWSEPTLIDIAFAMQALRISNYKKPRVYYDILKKD
ncbi:fatty acid amide hydrolase-like isoform X2 [Mercurialis annua]|uniref:fatty acid amide hydrolase-like isoform X2 n=1 Tax=Mercurialis annua TaxID=3986 RepID=UPI002160F00C|nr:fatty acid amide hydrolase-like isoform X2 [Mercurialis annua]